MTGSVLGFLNSSEYVGGYVAQVSLNLVALVADNNHEFLGSNPFRSTQRPAE
jgi:hypothetical protein